MRVLVLADNLLDPDRLKLAVLVYRRSAEKMGHFRRKSYFENFPVELFRIYKIKPWSILFNSKWNICSKMISQIWIWVGVICNKWGNIKSFFSWEIFFSKFKNWRFLTKMLHHSDFVIPKMLNLSHFLQKWPFSEIFLTQNHIFRSFLQKTQFLSFFLIETTHI